jgi:arylsulfatase A-like enzyme
MRQNVLLLILDAARRDAFEPYGAGPGSSPAVAQLAARGVALEHVYSTAPWTVPSHASFLTGLMPRAAGLLQVPSPAAAKQILAAQQSRFLPEVLRRAGYATVGISTNPWVSELSGFDTGFDDFTLFRTERNGGMSSDDLRGRWRWLREGAFGRPDDGSRKAEGEFGRWLAGRERAKPFFGFFNLTECHFPYLPPRPYGALSMLGRARAAADMRRYYRLGSLYRVNGRALEVPEDALERARRLYAGAVRYLDDWIARVLERLADSGVLDDTLVIVTADHGENFGEDGMIGHMLSLDERLIHVPLVAAGPGADALEASSLAALPQRIAEAVGLDEHPWHDGPPEGIGVAQSEPLGDASDPEVQAKLEEHGVVDEIGRARLTSQLTCAVREGLKLLRRDEREELFDLAADPLERAPLPPGALDPPRQRIVADLRAALEHPSMATVEPGVDAAVTVDEQSDAEKRDLEERMKLLGYM